MLRHSSSSSSNSSNIPSKPRSSWRNYPLTLEVSDKGKVGGVGFGVGISRVMVYANFAE